MKRGPADGGGGGVRDRLRSAARAAWRALRPVLGEYLGLVAVLVALVVFFSLRTDYFFSAETLANIANQIPAAVIVAVGMTFVLVIAGIDLSVGSVLALCGAVLGVCLKHWGFPLPLAILACVAVGLACGMINGLVTVRWRLPSFIVTLGMLEIARGAAFLVTNSRTLYVGASVERIATARVLGVSLPFLVALLVVIAGQFVLSRTVFGRYMIAVGTNEEAVRLSGIDTRRVKVAVFALCGLLVSIAAVIATAREGGNANPNVGRGFELEAIAAVVIGGTSLMGGRGSVVASFLGVVIMRVVSAGLTHMGAEHYTKRLMTGCIIVAAVIVDYYRHRLGKRRE